MSVTHQQISQPTPEQKVLKPFSNVKRGVVTLEDIYTWSINRSRDAMVIEAKVNFIGQDQYTYTDPQSSSPTQFQINSGYTLGGTPESVLQFKGYADQRDQSLQSRQLLTNVKFFDPLRELMHPRAEKVLIDVYHENQNAIESWEVGDDLENLLGLTSASELIEFLLEGSGISLRYMTYDYRIAYYRKEDYPLNIIKDLAEFIGAYIRYNFSQGSLEVLDRHPSSTSYYDFLYKDAGDIIDLGRNERYTGFYNAIQVFGTIPDNRPEYDKDEDIGIGLEEDNDLHLVDTIEGVERAPSDPYRSEPPVELIEKKFYNVFLGFEIDPATVELKGGSWNKETQEYEGAEFLAYGGQVSSDQVILQDVNDPNVEVSPYSMPPGEGLVGFPWRYEENSDGGSQTDYGIQDNIFRTIGVTGKVIDDSNDNPIVGATVELDFLYDDNVYQYWKYSYTDADGDPAEATFLFYLPEGSIALGDGWEDVTDDYPVLEDPVNIPAYTTTTAGDDTDEDGGKGVFTFNNVPLSDYKATASAPGYNEGDTDFEFADTSFDFLLGSSSDNTQKYKLIDTPYKVAIYAKKLAPIVFGADENYDEDAKIYPSKNIRVEVRHRRGIALANGKLIYHPAIQDPRVLSKEIATKAGGSVLIESLSKSKSINLQLPNNPWLRQGDRVGVESYAKGWTGSSRKAFTVNTVEQKHSVGGGKAEAYDSVSGVEYI